jgi:hypothetical protein
MTRAKAGFNSELPLISQMHAIGFLTETSMKQIDLLLLEIKLKEGEMQVRQQASGHGQDCGATDYVCLLEQIWELEAGIAANPNTKNGSDCRAPILFMKNAVSTKVGEAQQRP